jgi:hypothetical protein
MDSASAQYDSKLVSSAAMAQSITVRPATTAPNQAPVPKGRRNSSIGGNLRINDTPRDHASTVPSGLKHGEERTEMYEPSGESASWILQGTAGSKHQHIQHPMTNMVAKEHASQ